MQTRLCRLELPTDQAHSDSSSGGTAAIRDQAPIRRFNIALEALLEHMRASVQS